jgi:chromosome segregation ATPase
VKDLVRAAAEALDSLRLQASQLEDENDSLRSVLEAAMRQDAATSTAQGEPILQGAKEDLPHAPTPTPTRTRHRLTESAEVSDLLEKINRLEEARGRRDGRVRRTVEGCLSSWDASREQAGELRRQADALLTRCQAAEGALEGVRSELGQCKAELLVLRPRCGHLEGENARLEEVLTGLDARAHSVGERARAAEEALAQAQEEVTALRQQEKELVSQVLQRQAEASDAEHRRSELETELAFARDGATAAEQLAMGLKSTVAEVREELRKVGREGNELRAQAKAAHKAAEEAARDLALAVSEVSPGIRMCGPDPRASG